MNTRTVAGMETASTERVGRFHVLRALPARNLEQVDPFLFIDHMAPVQVKAGDTIRIPPHPHAGFEVVTYVLEGEFFHRDSRGHDQIGRPGDMNWMRAGSGIIHSEGPTPEFLRRGGRLSLVQAWINLPSKYKFTEPGFRHYGTASLPEIETKDGRIKILVGSLMDRKSPVETYSPVFYYHLKILPGKSMRIPVEENHSAALYVMEGKLAFGGEEASAGSLVHFHMDGNELLLDTRGETQCIVFGGLPINEKLVSYGPFVMNHPGEIQRVLADYEEGRMGSLDY